MRKRRERFTTIFKRTARNRKNSATATEDNIADCCTHHPRSDSENRRYRCSFTGIAYRTKLCPKRPSDAANRPLFDTGTDGDARLGAGGEVLYSSLDGIRRTPHADALQAIESAYSVAIVYGRRRFENRNTGITANPEVILIEVSNINPERNNSFKYALYEQFGIESNRYQEIWEYEQYIRLAEPGYDALCTLTAENADDECFIIAHEFMGMPFALKATLDGRANMRTIFYAHEVATVRRIVEEHAGHDTMFYNVMNRAMADGQSIGEAFGDQFDFFKHPLIENASACDSIFAVGDFVQQELYFLSHAHGSLPIDLVYNGIPLSS